MGWEKKELDFLTNIRGYFPKAYLELELQIRQYDPFLQSMLSDYHRMLLQYRGAYELIFESWIEVVSCLNAHYGNDKVGPTAIVWFFHFYIQGYLRKQYETINAAVAPPPLIKWVKTFLVQRKVDNLIPPFDLAPNLALHVKKITNISSVTPGGGGSGGGAPSSDGGRRTGFGGTPGGNTLGNCVENTNIDPCFQEADLRSRIRRGRIKTLKAKFEAQQPPICCPVGPHGQRCLSWHLKGYCYSKCSRKEDHVQLTDDDKDGMF